MLCEYLVRVTDATLIEAPARPPIITLTYAGADTSSEGVVLTDRLPITEKAIWRVAAFLRALDFKIDKKQLRVPFSALVGRTMVVEVDEDGGVRSYSRAPQK